MKNLYTKSLLFRAIIPALALFGLHSIQAQKTDVSLIEFKSIGIELLNNAKLYLGETEKFGIVATTKDGKTLKTKNLGGELKMTDFEIEDFGCTSNRIKTTISVQDGYNNITVGGFTRCVLIINPKGNKTFKDTVDVPIYTSGQKINAEYSGDSYVNLKNPQPPFHFPGMELSVYVKKVVYDDVPHLMIFVKPTYLKKNRGLGNTFWIINPKEQNFSILSNGSNGWKGTDANSAGMETRGGDGEDGFDGGNITVYITDDAYDLFDKYVNIRNVGGQGGRGGKGLYGSSNGYDGRKGRTGSVEVVTEFTYPDISEYMKFPKKESRSTNPAPEANERNNSKPSGDFSTNTTKFEKGAFASKLIKSERTNLGIWMDDSKWEAVSMQTDPSIEFIYQLKGHDVSAVIVTGSNSSSVEEYTKTVAGLWEANGMEIIKKEFRSVNNLNVGMLNATKTQNGIKINYLAYHYASAKGAIQVLVTVADDKKSAYQVYIDEFLNGLVETN